MMKHRISLWAFGASLGLLSSTACSLVVDTSVPAACGAEGECAGGECVDGACMSSALRPACATNTECRRAAAGEYCVNGRCIEDPVTDACSEVWPEGALSRDNDKLLIGFIGDISEQNGPNPYGKPPLEGVRLALEEIQNTNNGLPGVAGGTQRSLALLACKEVAGTDQDQPVRVARHLVEQAGVSAIIGASFSGNTLEVWDGFVSARSSALLMSPSATSPTISERTDKSPGNDPEDRLWRTSPSDEVQAALLRLLAQDVRAVLGRPNPRLLKFVKGDAAGTGLRNSLEEGLLADFGAGFHEDSNYQNPDGVAVDWAAQAARALREPLPDIIMGLGTEEFVQNILPLIEEQWPAGVLRPWYVLPEGDRNERLLSYAAERPELALNTRVVGTAPGARSSEYYEGFRRAFRGHFDGREPGNLAEFGYDAAYLLVYAIARANQHYPTALEWGAALNGLTCKAGGAALVTPGPSDFVARFELVASGACVDFAGASGELDFDVHGEAVSDIATWCLRSRGDAFVFEPTLPQYYDAVAGERRNPLNLADPNWCPPAP